MSKDVLKLGAKLTEKLSNTGLTDRELAEHFGVTKQAIYSWRKTGRIAKSRLPGLAALTGTTIAWWVGDDEEPMDPLERQLLDMYRQLSPEKRDHLLLSANVLLTLQQPKEATTANPFPLAAPPGTNR